MKTYRGGLSKAQKRRERERCAIPAAVPLDTGGFVLLVYPRQFRALMRKGAVVRSGKVWPRWRMVL